MLLFTLVLHGLVMAQGPAPRFHDPARRAKLEKAWPEFDRIMERYGRNRGVPGMAYGVVIDGQLARVKAWGLRDRESKAPVTEDTAFRIASMTKSFTAAAVLKLRDEGKLSLDDPIAKWIPKFRNYAWPTRDTAPARVRQLLTHGLGLPEDNPWGDRQLAESDARMMDWVGRGLPFSTPPDTEFEYSNFGFALAGQVVQKASGMAYRQYIERNILAPLGMTASSLEPTAIPADKLAKGYGLRDGEYFEIPSLAHGSFGAMGGMVTTPKDLAKWVAFLLDAFPPRDDADKGPVSRASRREMQRVWRMSDATAGRTAEGAMRMVAGGYGYGLSVTTDCRFGHIVGHGGGLPGFGSYMLWLPEYGVGLFMMANLTYAGASPSLHEMLDEMLATGGLEKRALEPSPALTSMRDSLWELWRQPSAQRLAQVAANNLEMDLPIASRVKEIELLRSRVGECRAPGAVDAENWLRGRFRMECDRALIDAAFTLAPTTPPTIQYLRFQELAKPTPSMERLISSLTGMMARADRAALAAMGDGGLDTETTARQLEAAGKGLGACRMAYPVGGDGSGFSRVRLDCERGPAVLAVTAGVDGKLRSAQFERVPGRACVP